MNTILFFGSFDPIHDGHIEIALQALNKIKHSILYFVPNNASLSKDLIAPSNDRVAMIKLAIKKYEKMKVSTFEADQKQFCYTYKTINHFKKTTRDNLFLLVGSDNFKNIDTWKESEFIKKNCEIIFFNRTGFVVNSSQSISDKLINISSTEIKANGLQNNLDIAVMQYINNHGLYAQFRLQYVMDYPRMMHSFRVAQTAKNLAETHDSSLINKAYIAGLYHDYCKDFEINEQRSMANLINFSKKDVDKVLHGPIARYYLKKYLHFDDELVLSAIAKHTTPFSVDNLNLTLLDKIVYCADKLEPLRTNNDIENIDQYRILATKDIDEAFKQIYNYFQTKRGEKCLV